MIEKLNIAPLSEDQIAALDVAGSVIVGMGKVLISTQYAAPGKFMAMISTSRGNHVTDYGSTLSEAFNGAIKKYEAWEPGAEPIRSAVEALDVIRERVDAGEDIAAILADIKVA